MNAPKTPKIQKKKPMTEKQAIQIMTKRRACIQKWRDTMKKASKGVPKKKLTQKNTTEPLVEASEKPKKKLSKKKAVEPLAEVPLETPLEVPLEVPEKPKKKASKKKVVELPMETPEKPKKRTTKKKTIEPIEEPLM